MSDAGTPQLALAQSVASRLMAVPGVVAVVLGGSWSRGAGDANSDIDLGIYYDPAQPPDIAALRALAAEIDDGHSGDVVTEPGAWGSWINGGGWLTVGGQRVDWLYRDLTRVHHEIEECRAGRTRVYYQSGHPHGFHNHIYMGEVHFCQPLADPSGALTALKALTTPYPPLMKQSLVEGGLWEAGFSLEIARKSAKRADVFHVTGLLFRASACLVQAAFALNERYIMNEKGAVLATATFERCPPEFAQVVASVLAAPGGNPEQLADSIRYLDALMQNLQKLC